MIRPRSLAVAIAAVGAATLTASSSAFTPSPSLPLAARPSKSLLHVGTALHQPDSFGGSFESDHNHPPSHQALPGGVHAPITVINSPRELADFLDKDDRICVIKFHAAWCKSCQRFGLKFQGLANEKTDVVDGHGNVVQTGPLRFGSIEFGANMGMCRTLEIRRLPTVHFYQKGQKLDGFPCGPAKFPLLLDKIHQLLLLQAPPPQEEAALEDILQQGDALMSSEQVSGVLDQLIEQEANGSLESAKTTGTKRNGKKKWWNIMP